MKSTRRGRRGPAALWLTTVTLAGLLVAAKAAFTHGYHGRLGTEGYYLSTGYEYVGAYERVRGLAADLSAAEVRASMADLAPLVRDPDVVAPQARYTCSVEPRRNQLGWRGTFDFTHDRLTSRRFEPFEAPAVVRWNRWGRGLDLARGDLGLLLLTGAGVALAVVVTPVARRHRRGLGHAAAAASLVGCVLASLSVLPGRTFRPVTSMRPSIAPVALLLIGLTVAVWPGRRRPDPGRCRRCGYDLTGNASGVCPECGTPVAGSGSSGGRINSNA